MEYIDIKKIFEKLAEKNYKEFVKGLVSFEKAIDNEEVLDKIYEYYMGNDEETLINENIINMED